MPSMRVPFPPAVITDCKSVVLVLVSCTPALTTVSSKIGFVLGGIATPYLDVVRVGIEPAHGVSGTDGHHAGRAHGGQVGVNGCRPGQGHGEVPHRAIWQVEHVGRRARVEVDRRYQSDGEMPSAVRGDWRPWLTRDNH